MIRRRSRVVLHESHRKLTPEQRAEFLAALSRERLRGGADPTRVVVGVTNTPPIDSGDCAGPECDCCAAERSIDEVIHPPLVAGGQGRTADEVARVGSVLMVYVLVAVSVLTLAFLYVAIDGALRR